MGTLSIGSCGNMLRDGIAGSHKRGPQGTLQAGIPGHILSFLQAGAAHLVGKPVALVDPFRGARSDPPPGHNKYAPFCAYLRGELSTGGAKANRSCERCSVLAARAAIKKVGFGEVYRYRCFMGLEEMALPLISRGALTLVAITGQFRSPEGTLDTLNMVERLGISGQPETEMTEGMRSSLAMLEYPPELWGEIEASEQEKERLAVLAKNLKPASDDDVARFCDQASRVREVVDDYIRLSVSEDEAELREALMADLSNVCSSHGSLWSNIKRPLSELSSRLGFDYAVLFAGEDERDTVLLPRVASDRFHISVSTPHFNWRRAGLKTSDSRDKGEQRLCWSSVDVFSPERLQRGFLGGDPDAFSDATAIVPSELPGGPFAVLVLGPWRPELKGLWQRQKVVALARDMCHQVLMMRLPEILERERLVLERTSKMIGHRVRVAVQGITSQVKANIDPPPCKECSNAVRWQHAWTPLLTSLKDLTEVSYGAESTIPGVAGVRVLGRETTQLETLVSAAVESQMPIAEELDIAIDIDPWIASMPTVLANTILMRSVFANVINNGLKYSYPPLAHRQRIIHIRRSYNHLGKDEVGIEVENFGLGIKLEDLERIFEWEVRLAPSTAPFRESYGRGLGLWECRYVVEGHGGRIFASSVHHTGQPVDDRDIKRCITTFTVVLPIA